LQTGYGGPLPEYDWSPYAGSSSEHVEPAGQVDGENGEDWPSIAQYDHEPRFNHSLQNTTSSQDSNAIGEEVNFSTTLDSDLFQCEECPKTFPQRWLLNKHMKKHFRPFPCGDCDKAFVFSKDLDRHRENKHPETVGGLTLFFCPVEGCKHSAERSTGTTRKDNMKRHIKTRHGSGLLPYEMVVQNDTQFRC